MKTLRFLIAAAVTVTLAVSANAASLVCETRVPIRGWVKVAPELNAQYGGRVVNLPRYGGWVTGRVAPGESFRWRVTASQRSERRVKTAAGLDFTMAAVEAQFGYFPSLPLPASGVSTIPAQRFIPAGSRFTVVAKTEAGRFAVNLPIGTR